MSLNGWQERELKNNHFYVTTALDSPHLGCWCKHFLTRKMLHGGISIATYCRRATDWTTRSNGNVLHLKAFRYANMCVHGEWWRSHSHRIADADRWACLIEQLTVEVSEYASQFT